MKYTERQKVEAERRAFVNGMIRMNGEMNAPGGFDAEWSLAKVEAIAAHHFPLPLDEYFVRTREDMEAAGWKKL